MESVIFLDTHAVVWIAAGKVSFFSSKAKKLIDKSDRLYISPMVVLELHYLHEMQRLAMPPEGILQEANLRLGVEIESVQLLTIVEQAKHSAWTRDPFDRLIVAHAAIRHDRLVTKDESILKHYPLAVW